MEQLEDRPPVPIAEIAPGPEEGGDDGIGRARGALDVAEQIKGDAQPMSGGHSQAVILKSFGGRGRPGE